MRTSLTLLIATMALMFTIAAMPISPSDSPDSLAERENEYDLEDFDFDCDEYDSDSDSDLDFDVKVKYPDFKECDEFEYSDCLDDPPRFSVQSNSHQESIPKVEDSWDAPQRHFVSTGGHARVNAGCAVLSPGWCLSEYSPPVPDLMLLLMILTSTQNARVKIQVGSAAPSALHTTAVSLNHQYVHG